MRNKKNFWILSTLMLMRFRLIYVINICRSKNVCKNKHFFPSLNFIDKCIALTSKSSLPFEGFVG